MIAPRLDGDAAPGGRGTLGDLQDAMERYNARLVLHHEIYVYERIPPLQRDESVVREFYHDMGMATGRRLSRWTRDFRQATYWTSDVVEGLARRGYFGEVWRDEEGMLIEAEPQRWKLEW